MVSTLKRKTTGHPRLLDRLSASARKKEEDLARLQGQIANLQAKKAIKFSPEHLKLQRQAKVLRKKIHRCKMNLIKKGQSIACKERDIAALRTKIEEFEKEKTGQEAELVQVQKRIDELLTHAREKAVKAISS